MLNLPVEFATVMLAFADLFSKRTFKCVQLLVVGAILAPGKRTITAILRVMGLSQEKHFQNYHRVLNRAVWSNRAVSQVLLQMLVGVFAPQGPLVMGLDDTIERRRGEKIKAKGIYRDPVRSSHSHFVKASGLRWLAVMLLVEIPWAQRVWALPFLTALAPSERYDQQRGHCHKTLTDWGRQMLLQVRRWLPQRELFVVGDSSFAALELLATVSQMTNPVHMITRLRLDAALYQPAPLRNKGQMGRPRLKGKRLPNLSTILTNPKTQWQSLTINGWYGGGKRIVEVCTGEAVWYHTGMPLVPMRWVLVRDPENKFDAQAFLCTNQQIAPLQILEWFVRRWQIEVTFQEVRAHLGVETQRQWSDLAIARTTPALLGLFSLITLVAHHLQRSRKFSIRRAAWYAKPLPTFVDAIALVRQYLWSCTFSMSDSPTEMVKIPRALLERLTDTLGYAA